MNSQRSQTELLTLVFVALAAMIAALLLSLPFSQPPQAPASSFVPAASSVQVETAALQAVSLNDTRGWVRADVVEPPVQQKRWVF